MSIYPPDWVPRDPPDDLDDLMREEWQDPTFRAAWDRLAERQKESSSLTNPAVGSNE